MNNIKTEKEATNKTRATVKAYLHPDTTYKV